MSAQPVRPRGLDRRRGDHWRYERFRTTIREQTGLDRDHAERVAMAAVVTLAERIPKARAEELAEDLPERLRFWLADANERPEIFRVEEFTRRVAERTETDAPTAARYARAALRALARIAPAYEIDDLVDELPRDFQPLVGDVAREIMNRTESEIRSFSAFVDSVRRRAGLGMVEAERAADTVLETLAERLVAGEVEDLQAALPAPFREPLERGKAHVRGKPRAMLLDEFVERVAQKEGVSFQDAFAHTRAVFATLAAALPPKELRDILHELPRGYRDALF